MKYFCCHKHWRTKKRYISQPAVFPIDLVFVLGSWFITQCTIVLTLEPGDNSIIHEYLQTKSITQLPPPWSSSFLRSFETDVPLIRRPHRQNGSHQIKKVEDLEVLGREEGDFKHYRWKMVWNSLSSGMQHILVYMIVPFVWDTFWKCTVLVLC